MHDTLGKSTGTLMHWGLQMFTSVSKPHDLASVTFAQAETSMNAKGLEIFFSEFVY